MSYTKNVTLWCDGVECYAWINGMSTTVEIARIRAQREESWVYSKGKDYCHRCAKEKGLR